MITANCPYCNAGPIMCEEVMGLTHYYVRCNVCKARGPHAGSARQALNGWNVRGGQSQADADHFQEQFDHIFGSEKT